MRNYVDFDLRISDSSSIDKFSRVSKHLGYVAYCFTINKEIFNKFVSKLKNINVVYKEVYLLDQQFKRTSTKGKCVRSLYLTEKPGINRIVRYGKVFDTLIFSRKALLKLTEGDIREITSNDIAIELRIKDILSYALSKYAIKLRKIIYLINKHAPRLIVSSGASEVTELWSPYSLISFLTTILGIENSLAIASVGAYPYSILRKKGVFHE